MNVRFSLRDGEWATSRAPSGNARGFSLVEILVVITIMALLVGLVASSATSILESANVTTCQNNLKEIAQNMLVMKNDRRKTGKPGFPKYKGIRFLLELTKGGRTGKYAYVSGQQTKIFICPGTDDVNTIEGDSTPGSAYFDLENLDSYTISYAGRNQEDFPIERDPLGDDAVLAADDNELRPNHKRYTNYVTVGAVVDSLDITDFLDENPDLEELNYLPVGPDSPHEEFRKLLVEE